MWGLVEKEKTVFSSNRTLLGTTSAPCVTSLQPYPCIPLCFQFGEKQFAPFWIATSSVFLSPPRSAIRCLWDPQMSPSYPLLPPSSLDEAISFLHFLLKCGIQAVNRQITYALPTQWERKGVSWSVIPDGVMSMFYCFVTVAVGKTTCFSSWQREIVNNTLVTRRPH